MGNLPLEAGQIVGGKYVVERVLGQGGMGAVFMAKQERLDRFVAIKVLLPSVMDNPEVVARFDREARAAASLQSEHVTRIVDVGHLDDGAPYMVMELLQGEDLAESLARRGFLPHAEAVALIVQACDAIEEAHTLGIVHRDLKPANLFLAKRPNGTTTVKVLDFGISKVPQSRASTSLTATSAVMGSPLYMSPEQRTESRNVDARADIWALGVTLYELIAGVPPFSAPSVAEITVLVLTTQPAPLRTHRPEVPESIEVAVMRCLRRDPADRYANISELVTALQSGAAKAHPSRDPPVDPSAVAPTLVSGVSQAATPQRGRKAPAAGEQTVDPVSSTRPPDRRRKTMTTAVAAAAVLVVAIVSGALALRGSSDGAPPAASSSLRSAPSGTIVQIAPPLAMVVGGDPSAADAGGSVIPTVDLANLPPTPSDTRAPLRPPASSLVDAPRRAPTPQAEKPSPGKPGAGAPKPVDATPPAAKPPADIDPFSRLKPK